MEKGEVGGLPKAVYGNYHGVKPLLSYLVDDEGGLFATNSLSKRNVFVTSLACNRELWPDNW